MRYVYIKKGKIIWVSDEKISLGWAKEIETSIEWKIVLQDWEIIAETETKEYKAKELAKEEVAKIPTSKYSDEKIEEIIELKKRKIFLNKKLKL